MQLYVDSTFASPYAMSAFVSLREKGIAFDLVPVNLSARENMAEQYSQLSLTNRVPTLVHEDFALSESSAISEYLDDAFPNVPLYPQDLKLRARARQIQAWIRSDLMPIRQERTTEVVFLKPTPVALSASAQATAAQLFAVANGLISSTDTGMFGPWCIADTDLALMLNRLILNGDSVPEKLVTWASQQWQRPSVQAWVNLKRD